MFMLTTFEVICVTLNILQLMLMSAMFITRRPKGVRGLAESLIKFLGWLVDMVSTGAVSSDGAHSHNSDLERGENDQHDGPSYQSYKSRRSLHLEEEPENDSLHLEDETEGAVSENESDASSYQSFN